MQRQNKLYENIPNQASFTCSRWAIQYNSTRKTHILIRIWDDVVESMSTKLTELSKSLCGKLPRFEDGPNDCFNGLILTNNTDLRDIHAHILWCCWALISFDPIFVTPMEATRTWLKGYTVPLCLQKNIPVLTAAFDMLISRMSTELDRMTSNVKHCPFDLNILTFLKIPYDRQKLILTRISHQILFT